MERTKSPFVRPNADAPVLVELDQDHPGFRDSHYRERRNFIADIAYRYEEGEEVPEAPYTDDEHDVWAFVQGQLHPLFDTRACRQVLEAREEAQLPRDRIPQFAWVNAMLQKTATAQHVPFQMRPVAGLIDGGVFLSYLGRHVFLGTQYVRHHSKPLYTPEPDVIHELVGHAMTLVHPRFARINRLFGAAVEGADDERILQVLRAYWYTVEFGLVKEGDDVKAFGAGLLSSFGEIQRFDQADIRPLDLDACGALPFDPTCYQEVLFCADSFDDLEDKLQAWLT